jgi:hypothetical protein
MNWEKLAITGFQWWNTPVELAEHMFHWSEVWEPLL